MTTNIIFGIKQTSKKCESIVIQMVINNLSRIKCGKKLKKPQHHRMENNCNTMTTNIIFGIKQLQKSRNQL